MPPISSLKAVLFDKDGTLLDFRRSREPFVEHIVRALSDGDPNQRRRLENVLGYSDGQFAPDSVLISGSIHDAARALNSVRTDLDVDILIHALAESSKRVALVPVDGLRHVISHCRAIGLRLALLARDDEADARANLQELNIAEAFDVVVGGDSGAGATPDAGPCLAAALALGVDPAECAMVCASRDDLVAARAAGMFTIGVTSGYLSVGAMAELADLILPDIAIFSTLLSADSIAARFAQS